MREAILMAAILSAVAGGASAQDMSCMEKANGYLDFPLEHLIRVACVMSFGGKWPEFRNHELIQHPSSQEDRLFGACIIEHADDILDRTSARRTIILCNKKHRAEIAQRLYDLNKDEQPLPPPPLLVPMPGMPPLPMPTPSPSVHCSPDLVGGFNCN